MLTVEPEGESPTEAFDIYKKRALKFLNTDFPDEIKEYNLVNLHSRNRFFYIIKIISFFIKNVSKNEFIYSRSLLISHILLLLNYKNLIFFLVLKKIF